MGLEGTVENMHADFMNAVDIEMRDRGITNPDSDAFDASRDLILLDAADRVGGSMWLVDNVDGTTTVYVSFTPHFNAKDMINVC